MPKSNYFALLAFFALLALFALPGDGGADEFTFDLDTLPQSTYLDRWMYPFNISPGSRIQAPIFGAIGSPDFDERDGQYLIAWNTAELGIASGLPPQQYQVNSATLVLTETFGGYAYDPSYDAFETYLDPDVDSYQEDEDEGRPIELYGVGMRNGFHAFAWPDGTASEAPAFGSGSSFAGEGGSGKRERLVFAAAADGSDVSNNVDSLSGGVNGFDPTPFSVAKLVRDDSELAPGEIVAARTQWVFEIDIDNSAIATYFANSLSAGELGLIATSMHATGVQGAGDPFPNPATANHFAFEAPVLSIDVDIVDLLPGDLDNDGALTASDIDLLSDAIRSATFDPIFDLSGDGTITFADHTTWLSLTGVIPGDTDFSGDVVFADFLRLSQNFGSVGGWHAGDFDGSGDITFSDFLTLSGNFGQSDVTAVPEPTANRISCIGLLAALSVARGIAASHRRSDALVNRRGRTVA